VVFLSVDPFSIFFIKVQLTLYLAALHIEGEQLGPYALVSIQKPLLRTVRSQS